MSPPEIKDIISKVPKKLAKKESPIMEKLQEVHIGKLKSEVTFLSKELNK